jgi:hypothetical protein
MAAKKGKIDVILAGAENLCAASAMRRASESESSTFSAILRESWPLPAAYRRPHDVMDR